MTLRALAWTLESSPAALVALAQRTGVELRTATLPETGDLERAASHLGIEVEAVDFDYRSLDSGLVAAAPALVRIADVGWIAIVGGGRRSAIVLAPDLVERRLTLATLRDALVGPIEAELAAEIDAILDVANVRASRRDRARAAILRARLGARRVATCVIVRSRPGSSFGAQLADRGVGSRLVGLLGAHALRYALMVLGWWIIGRGALDGRLDAGWLRAWALVIVSQIPCATLTTWWQGRVAVDAGALVKQRLLAGALLLAPEDVRTVGVGEPIGRVHEAEAFESLALGAGMTGVVAVLEIVAAGGVLTFGVAWGIEVGLLVGWVLLLGAGTLRYRRDRARWTAARVALTNDLVERMAGHRTRIAQQAPERWHDGEDEAIERYLELSRRMDGVSVALGALVPGGWGVVSLLGLAPSVIAGGASVDAVAITLGGILLAYRAFHKLAGGVTGVVGALVAWDRVAPLFRAASDDAAFAPRSSVELPKKAPSDAIMLQARDIVFRYRERGTAVLRGINLDIRSGDRVLLEGGSGSGKSTLGALLAGLREPEAGALLLRGFDRATLGLEAWRRRIVAAPQFHENHVLSATFAFNLFMGSSWPPEPEDEAEARALCEELGLGPLLRRMPAGFEQLVGETGWQLSHGEKSRLFIARALLQRPDVLVLDESFAALDPVTLRRSLDCVTARADSLVVIAHP